MCQFLKTRSTVDVAHVPVADFNDGDASVIAWFF